VGINEIELQYSSQSTVNSVASLEGFIHCNSDSIFLKTQILTLGRIPIESMNIGTLAAFEPSMVEIPLPSLGNTSQSFTVELDGPLSRIGSISNQLTLDGNDIITLQIEPNGLLEDRMAVKGELILISQSGHRWTMELEYTAVDGERSTLEEWRTPGKLLGSAGIICILWISIGMFERNKKSIQVQQIAQIAQQDIEIHHDQDTDAWGRSIDEGN